MASIMERKRIFLNQNGKLVTCWAHNMLVPSFTRDESFQKNSKQEAKAGDNTLSQINCNGALQEGKAITLNSVEIKIVRTRAKTPLEEFSYWVFGFYDRATFSMCDVELSAT